MQGDEESAYNKRVSLKHEFTSGVKNLCFWMICKLKVSKFLIGYVREHRMHLNVCA